MIVFMIILFLVGYFCIAMEHPFKVNKAASALLMAALLWTAYILYAPSFLPGVEEFNDWVKSQPCRSVTRTGHCLCNKRSDNRAFGRHVRDHLLPAGSYDDCRAG